MMNNADLLYENFIEFCEKNDKEQAVYTATILIDEYKSVNNLKGILILNYEFNRLFKLTTSYTESWLIRKEAINVVQLTTCIHDDDFMLSSIKG